MLRIFERISRRIYGPIKENCIWRSRYNHELYKLYNEPDSESWAVNMAGAPFLEYWSTTLAGSSLHINQKGFDE
jgi:hypothetical protein